MKILRTLAVFLALLLLLGANAWANPFDQYAVGKDGAIRINQSGNLLFTPITDTTGTGDVNWTGTFTITGNINQSGTFIPSSIKLADGQNFTFGTDNDATVQWDNTNARLAITGTAIRLVGAATVTGNLTCSANISGVYGTFSNALSAASGSFSGAVTITGTSTLAAVNASGNAAFTGSYLTAPALSAGSASITGAETVGGDASAANYSTAGVVSAAAFSVTGAVTAGSVASNGAVTATYFTGSNAASVASMSVTGDFTAGGGFYVSYAWAQENMTGTQTEVAMNRLGSTFATVVKQERAGSLMGIAVAGSATVSIGTVTFVVTKNGATIGYGVAMGVGQQFFNVAIAKDTYTFAAGDTIGIQYTTTDDYDPQTLDWTVDLIIEK